MLNDQKDCDDSENDECDLSQNNQLQLSAEVMQLRKEVWDLKVELDILSRFIEHAKYLGEVFYGKGSGIDDIIKKRVM